MFIVVNFDIDVLAVNCLYTSRNELLKLSLILKKYLHNIIEGVTIYQNNINTNIYT